MYDFYTIHTNSNVDSSTTQGNNYTTFLFNTIENIVQVSVVFFSFHGNVSTSNICYLCVDELVSPYNYLTGTPASNTAATYNPSSAGLAEHPIGIFEVKSGRTVYQQNDYSTQTQFPEPIGSLDRLRIRLRNADGDLIDLIDQNVYITFRFTCAKKTS
jgi:hypothetical protein